jgi:hypothetical protein
MKMIATITARISHFFILLTPDYLENNFLESLSTSLCQREEYYPPWKKGD